MVGISIEAFQLITLKETDPNWQSSIKTRIISLNISRLMIIQFIYFCDFISSRIKVLNLLRIEILSTNASNNIKVLGNIKIIKSLDLCISEILQLTCEYFKWMLLLNITLDVISITIDIYWIYGGFRMENPNFIQSCCCPWSKIVNITLLFYSCNYIQKHRDNTLIEIFEWKTNFDNALNSKRRLLLQNLHTSKFFLNANGFFYIDYSTLIGIIEAITIYMVYFFQFMSSNIFILAIERIENKKYNNDSAVY
ncbi:hypothetical protein PVAND_006643 [Polypedilum vanderplanki]|uniref:Gustatory receptor n=1 Tax=Polypedilum vanderplanki TaxID=319348 RepID=A0A9J6C3U3_POLVA|nr:hypothetical protein PVAND_006643 [Polypedilum vanderplanki]